MTYGGPVWRAAPVRLPRTPGWFLLVAAAATLLVASVVAPALFAAGARTSALDAGLEAVEGDTFALASPDLRVSWNGLLMPDDDARLLERLSELPGYADATLAATGSAGSRGSLPVVKVGERREVGTLWWAEGAVEALGGEAGQGVWLPEELAAAVGAGPGDPVRLGMYRAAAPTLSNYVKVRVAGTYPTAPRSRLPEVMADRPDADRLVLPVNPDLPGAGSPLVITDRETFGRLVRDVGERALFTADLVLTPGLTPDVAEDAVAGVKQLGDDAYGPGAPLASLLLLAEPAPARLSIGTGLPGVVLAAEATAEATRSQVRPYAVSGGILAAVLVAAGWVLHGRSRGAEDDLLTGVGLRPLERAALAGLEALPACVVAVPAGILLAVAGVTAAGPPVAPGVADLDRADLTRALLGGGAALLLVALASGVAGWRADRRDRASRLGRVGRSVPWTAAVLAATVAAGAGVATTHVSQRAASPLTTVLPLLVALSCAALVLKVVGFLPVGWTGGRPGGARWLAGRRTGRVVREVTALTAVLAVALSLLGYALAVRRGVEEGVDDKVAAITGADTAIALAQQLNGHGRKRALEPPVAGTTVVWRHSASIPPTFGEVPVMAVDLDTFTDVADWGASDVLADARGTLPDLVSPGREEPLPVVMAGASRKDVGETGILNFSDQYSVSFVIAAVVEAFPGSELDSGTVTVIASSRDLLKRVPAPVKPFVEGSDTIVGAWSSWVWAETSAAELRAALRDEGLFDEETVVAGQESLQSRLPAQGWAAGYLLALGAVVLALAIGAGFVLALRLADRDATSDVLLARMGWTPSELGRARAWEVAYAVLVAGVATAAAITLLLLGPGSVDATPAMPPVARARTGLGDAVLLGGLVVGVVLLAWLVGAVRARRRVPEEVLRGNA